MKEETNTSPVEAEAFSQAKTSTFNYSRFWIVLVVVVVTVAVGVTLWYLYNKPKSQAPLQELRVNHLIEGVPYYGQYNLYPDFTGAAKAAAMILRYYGDERFTFDQIKNAFPDERHNAVPNYPFSTRFQEFFEHGEYDTSLLIFHVEIRSRAMDEIKKYIQQDVPVIVYQIQSPDRDVSENSNRAWRVVIGVFDDTEKIIVHDYTGNNTEFSYEEFNGLFSREAGLMIAVWPRDTLLAEGIQKPVSPEPYSERLPFMDDPGIETITNLSIRARAVAADADAICTQGLETKTDISDEFVRLHTESIELRDEIINHPSFGKMSVFWQFVNKLWKARSMVRIGKATEARSYLLEEVIPLNHDLNIAQDGSIINTGFYEEGDKSTFRLINGQASTPWLLVYRTYRLERNDDMAAEIFRNNVLPIEQDSEWAQEVVEKHRQGNFYDPGDAYWCMGGKEMVK